MRMNPTKKYRLALIASWLIARLWGSFEISRLLFFRIFTGNRMVRISRIGTPISRTEWVYEPPRLFGLTFDFKQDQFVLRRVAEIMKN